MDRKPADLEKQFARLSQDGRAEVMEMFLNNEDMFAKLYLFVFGTKLEQSTVTGQRQYSKGTLNDGTMQDRLSNSHLINKL